MDTNVWRGGYKQGSRHNGLRMGSVASNFTFTTHYYYASLAFERLIVSLVVTDELPTNIT